MTQELANQIIIEALNVGLLKGCYNLQEATNIVKAIDTLSNSNQLPIETPLPFENDKPSE